MLLCRSRTYDCPITSPGRAVFWMSRNAPPKERCVTSKKRLRRRLLSHGISWVNGLALSLKSPNGLRPPRVCCSSVVKHPNYNQTVFGSTRFFSEYPRFDTEKEISASINLVPRALFPGPPTAREKRPGDEVALQ